MTYAQHCLDWAKNGAERALQAASADNLDKAYNEAAQAVEWLKVAKGELKAAMKRKAEAAKRRTA